MTCPFCGSDQIIDRPAIKRGLLRWWVLGYGYEVDKRRTLLCERCGTVFEPSGADPAIDDSSDDSRRNTLWVKAFAVLLVSVLFGSVGGSVLGVVLFLFVAAEPVEGGTGNDRYADLWGVVGGVVGGGLAALAAATALLVIHRRRKQTGLAQQRAAEG